jgi:hypothetical protein
MFSTAEETVKPPSGAFAMPRAAIPGKPALPPMPATPGARPLNAIRVRPVEARLLQIGFAGPGQRNHLCPIHP